MTRGFRAHMLLAFVGALVTACVRPAADRVRRDERVGLAVGDGVQVEVVDGLAVVRSLSAESLQLWANAPNLDLRLDFAVERDYELRVRNCMPRSTLRTVAGEVAAIESAPSQGLDRSWTLAAVHGTVKLALREPEPEQPRFDFAVMGDVQEAIDEVQDIYQRMNAEPGLSFVLSTGDLTSQGTREELERFQLELGGLEIPYFSTLGNHELGTSPPPFHEYFGRGSAHFTFRGTQFTLLDSASATVDPIVYQWLDSWLDQGRNSPHVVATHIPPFDPIGVRNGAFASRAEAAKLLGRLAEGGVDLTLYGHIHSYYAFENAGIQAYISGGGGAIPERFDGVGRHFLVVSMDRERGVLGTRVVRVD